MQSSPTLMWQLEICTYLQLSGFIPSVFGDSGLLIVTPVTVTFSQNSGFTVQKGEFVIVIPSIKTFLQNIGWINGGRRKPRSNVDGSSGLIAFLLFFTNLY